MRGQECLGVLRGFVGIYEHRIGVIWEKAISLRFRAWGI